MSNIIDDSNDAPGIKVGDPATDFTLTTEDGKRWRLSEHFGNVTVLLFYPKSETLVCTRQLCSVRDHWNEYLDTKANIIGISPGTVEEHQLFIQRHGLPITILADYGRAVTKIYSRHWFLPIQFSRAIVIIDTKGIIRHREIMCRAFRPSDKNLIASIYAARTDFLYEKIDSLLKESRENNQPL